ASIPEDDPPTTPLHTTPPVTRLRARTAFAGRARGRGTGARSAWAAALQVAISFWPPPGGGPNQSAGSRRVRWRTAGSVYATTPTTPVSSPTHRPESPVNTATRVR